MLYVEVTRKYNLLLAKFGLWYYRLKSTNGKILFYSETFYSKSNAKRQAGKLAKANGWELRVEGKDK